MSKDYRKEGMVVGAVTLGALGLVTGGIGIAMLGTAIGVKGLVAGLLVGGTTGRLIGAEVKKGK